MYNYCTFVRLSYGLTHCWMVSFPKLFVDKTSGNSAKPAGVFSTSDLLKSIIPTTFVGDTFIPDKCDQCAFARRSRPLLAADLDVLRSSPWCRCVSFQHCMRMQLAWLDVRFVVCWLLRRLRSCCEWCFRGCTSFTNTRWWVVTCPHQTMRPHRYTA